MRHDKALFQRWVDELELDHEFRTGSMFGTPAAFVGKRLAFGVYEANLCSKLPPEQVQKLLQSGVGHPFRPFGRPVMRGWISLSPTEVPHDQLRELLIASLRFAGQR